METVRFSSHGGFSVRSILTFVLAVVITALLWATFASTPTHAADATWNGASINYSGDQYLYVGEAKQGESHNLPVGSKYYAFVEPDQNATNNSSQQKAYVIYFAPGVDPPAVSAASYAEYTYNSATKTYSNPTQKQNITIEASGNTEISTSCAIEGIGWMVCPIMTFLSTGMDMVFTALSEFMKVQPLQTGNTQNSLFSAWNIMRGIANIAFIIVFIIIIYAQLTSIQVSNYGIKRLLPRLIIGAIAVNVSYIICAVAIDISNILGFSLQDIFTNLRNQLLSTPGANPTETLLSWQSITGFVLSGGTAAAAVSLGAVGTVIATGGTIAAAVYILLPALVGLLITILVVLLILAARQAIITILVVIAPIAIVAYLLPNTEKWFEKWRGLLMTMLIFFPAFSVVFGGSQLAGAIIIQNADSINMLILGMIVQVAPLVITPLLLKFSGGLLGNIARAVNNPNKGVIDRTRNWSKDRAEWHRKRGVSGAKMNGDPGELRRRNFLRNSAGYLDQRKRRLSDRTKNAETGAENAYHSGRLYNKHDLATQTAAFDDDKKRIHNEHGAHVEHNRVTPGSLLYGRTIQTETSKQNLEAAEHTTGAHLNAQRTLAGSALNASLLSSESAKARLETSDNLKNVYLNNERVTAGTQLNATVQNLEASKLNVETANSRYAAMVDGMKVDPTSTVNGAAINAQSSKDHAEAAQIKLQTYFDRERATDGTLLNVSNVELETSRVTAEGAKAQLSDYVATIKSTGGTTIHTEVLTTERLKQGQQVAESQLTRLVEEYKSGAADTTGLSLQEQTIIEDMVRNTEQLAAEAQGTQAAKNMQTKRISEAFTETYLNPETGKEERTERAEELLNIAKSVDEYGDVRAEASAHATLEDILNKARTANESLIEERASAKNQTPKNYALDLLNNRLNGDMSQSEDIIRAAMEIAGKEAQIPTLRKIRKSKNFNQDHLSAMLIRNSGTMKAKGAFDLQNDMGLIHASDEVMDASIAGTLGSTSAEQFKDLKNGAIIDYATNMETIIAHTEQMENSSDGTERKYGKNGIEGIQKTYFQLTLALRDPQMVRALGDNLIPAIKMHRKIHANPRFHNDTMEVDYKAIDPQDLSVDPKHLGDSLPGSA